MNNGGGARFSKPPETLSYDEWQKVIDLILSAPFLCAQRVGAITQTQMSGKTINVSSVAGIKGAGPISRYGAAKGGLIRFSKFLASAASEGLTGEIIPIGAIVDFDR